MREENDDRRLGGTDRETGPVSFSEACLRHLRSRWLALSLLALSLLVVVGVRVRLLDFPLERDEGEYAYAGQLILDGIPPYQLAYSMKMPGTYLAYATVMSIFGQTTAGIHLGLLAVHLATLALLFLIARNFFNFHGAALATAACALMTLSPAYYGLAAHATHFVMLPALLGLWLLLGVEKNGRLLACLAGGCLLGAAFLMKQPGLFFGFFGGLYLAWSGLWRGIGWRRVLARVGVYALGWLLPFLAVCLWLAMAGVFGQFWFWTVSYAREYGSMISLAQGLARARFAFARLFHAAPLLWMIGGLGLACLCLGRMALNCRIFLGGFFVFSFLAVCPGLYFRPHYFILLVPAVALLAGLAVSWTGGWLARKDSPRWLRCLPFLLGAVACAEGLYADRAVLFSLSPSQACQAVYGVNAFAVSPEIGRYLEQNTGKDQRIAVIGSEPQIYFYARRHSSTGQIYTFPLMEPQPFARKMQENMIREIQENPPEYVVMVSVSDSWLRNPDSIRQLIGWVNGYVNHNMQRVGLIQFISPQTTETVWGPEAAAAAVHSKSFIAVYKRAAPG